MNVLILGLGFVTSAAAVGMVLQNRVGLKKLWSKFRPEKVRDLESPEIVKNPEIVSKIPTQLEQLPAPPPDFTGRNSELNKLKSCLDQGKHRVLNLHGKSGMGKTSLALKLAEDIKNSYPDAQIYLDLKGDTPKPLPLRKIVGHIIQSFQIDVEMTLSEDQLMTKFRAVIEEKRILFLLDNVFNPEQIDWFQPTEGSLSILISRKRIEIEGVFSSKIRKLLPKDAESLIRKISPQLKPHSKELAEICSGHPMSLRLAASSFRQNSASDPLGYIAKLKAAGQSKNPFQAFARVSYEMLSQAGQKRLAQLTVFPGTFDLKAIAAVWGEQYAKIKYPLASFIENGLIEWNGDSGRCRLHLIIRRAMESSISESELEQAKLNHAEYYLSVFEKCSNFLDQGHENYLKALRQFDIERENIDTGQHWAAQRSLSYDKAAKICSEFAYMGGSFFNLRFQIEERCAWLEPALDASIRIEDPYAQGSILICLGNLHNYLDNDKKSLKYHEEALAIAEDEDILDLKRCALGNLASNKLNEGEVDEAIKMFKQLLSQSIEYGDTNREIYSRVCLGDGYNLRNQYDQAKQQWKLSLDLAKSIGDYRAEANTLWIQARAIRNWGNEKEAMKMGEKALEIYKLIEDQNVAGIEYRIDLWKGEPENLTYPRIDLTF
jgi:hypothetical protein